LLQVFRVWIHPQKDDCRVRADGLDNAKWLLKQLSHSFVFRSFEPIVEDRESAHCTFQVPCNPPLTPAALCKLLDRIPEIRLLCG